MSIRVLGPLSHDGDAGFGRRDRAVLTALALYVGRAVSADRLAEAVWGDDPPSSSHKALQGCIVRLRRALGPDTIETSAQGYRMVLPAEEVDAQRFERMVARSRELLALGEPERAGYLLAQSLDLWRGRAFEDVETWDPALVEAGRLDELRLEAEELRVDAALCTGRHLDVLAAAEGMVKAAPLRERRWMQLALAQYQSGRQTEALRTIHRLKTVLADRLGLDPGPEIAALEQAILRQGDSLLAADWKPVSATCPYRGLTSYDVADTESFFGRDDDVRACLELLRTRDALAVVGPSGSGKSSLVRAGVAASLLRDGRRVLVITPGEHPMEALAAIADSGSRSVLLVDQCEEAFSLCSDETERKAFFAALVHRAELEPLALAMRADRLADVSSYPGFARLLECGLHLLGAMTEQGLRDAVQAPARQAGLLIEPGLVDLLVGEVEGKPGALLMLSHALLETWKRREGENLTVAGYTASGGIRGAVAQSAEKVYSTVDPQHRPLLRDLVLRLVTSGAEGEPVRGRVPRRLLSADPGYEDLIDLLVESRLVTSDSGVVEIAHEALARAWPRLRGWLDDDVEGQRILHHLTRAADAWDSMGRPDSELYRGARASKALEWRGRQDTTLTRTEVAFLEATARVEQSELRAAAQRALAQARLIRRQRMLLAGATVLLCVALVAGAFAVRQADRAATNAAAAADAALTADARRLGARALATGDITMSMLFAAAGVQLDDSPATRSSLLAALARKPELMASTPMEGSRVLYFDVSPDGGRVASYDIENRVRLYDIVAGEMLAEFQAGSERLLGWESAKVAFSPDGRTIAVTMAAPSREPVKLLDAETLRPLPEQPGGLRGGRWQLLGLRYSHDGHHLAVSLWRVRGTGSSTRSTTPTAFVWDFDSPQDPTARIRLTEGTPFVELSPDGSVLYTTSPLTMHDLQAGTSVRMAEPLGGSEPVETLTMSPDGRLLAAPGAGGVVLFDAATGELRRKLPGDDLGFYVTFSGDGSRVATVTFGKREAVVWDVATGDVAAQLPLGEGGEVVDFGPDGSTLYSAGSDSALRHWDLDGDDRFIAQVALVPPRLADLSFVRPAPGGGFIAYPNGDDISFLEVDTNTVGEPLHRGVGYRRGGGSWHPDGAHFALSTGNRIRIWNAAGNQATVQGGPDGPSISAIDYSTDGSRLVIGDLSGQVTMLEATTLEPVGRQVLLGEPVSLVSAGPDNHTVVALTGDLDASGFWVGTSPRWALVDLKSGRVLKSGALGVNGTVVDFSPDGRHVAVGGRDGEVLVLDLATGEPVRQPVVLHDDGVLAVTYSADGNQFLTSGPDSSVGLWQGQTGQLLAQVVVPTRFTEATFRDETDSVLIAPLWGGPVYQWNTRIDNAVTYGCRVAGREFTVDEWTDELGDRPYRQVCSA